MPQKSVPQLPFVKIYVFSLQAPSEKKGDVANGKSISIKRFDCTPLSSLSSQFQIDGKTDLNIFDDAFNVGRSLVQLFLVGTQIFTEIGRVQEAIRKL